MKTSTKAFIALSAALMFSTANAATIGGDTAPQVTAHQVKNAEWSSSKVGTTMAWLKRKKVQTTRWMGRQKQKLKQLAD